MIRFPHSCPSLQTILFVITMGVVAVVGLGFAAPSYADPSWGSGGGGWSGSGSVYLPGGRHVGQSVSSGNSECAGCRWEVRPLCRDGVLDPCLPMPPYVACARGEIRYEVRFGSNGAATKLDSAPCIPNGSRPVSAAEIENEVEDRVRQLAPTLRFSFQPSARPVTQIPTLFRVDQPNDVSRSDMIAGLGVQMRARVSRVLQWGDGSSKRTTERGGRWPDTSLSHNYRTAGIKRVRLTANWTAEYSVSGGSWIQASGDPVQQTATRTLRVREARAQLVD